MLEEIRKIEFNVPIVVGGTRTSPAYLFEKLQQIPCFAITPQGEIPTNHWRDEKGEYHSEGIKNELFLVETRYNRPNPELTKQFAESQGGFFFPESTEERLGEEERAMFRSCPERDDPVQAKIIDYPDFLGALKACLPNFREDPRYPEQRQTWISKISQLEGLEKYVPAHGSIKILGKRNFSSGRTFIGLKSNRDQGVVYSGILIYSGFKDFEREICMHLDTFVKPEYMEDLRHERIELSQGIQTFEFLSRNATRILEVVNKYTKQNAPTPREQVWVGYDASKQTFNIHSDNFRSDSPCIPTLEVIARSNNAREFLTSCIRAAAREYKSALNADSSRLYADASANRWASQ